MDKNISKLDLAHQYAKKKNAKCLSAKYINIDSKLLWQCELGHQWEASFYSVKARGSWCPYCAGNTRLTIEEKKAIALSKKGLCLSPVYINSHTKLLWQCELGHQWEAAPSPIKHRDVWCPHCAKRAKLSIEQMHEIAIRKGGKCLSNEYFNNDSKLLWECEYGHQWSAAPTHIKSGSWCPKCAGNVCFTIEYMKELARAREGDFLSTNYKNINHKLLWKCKYGHQWFATPRDITDGKWCRECYGSGRRGEHAVRNFFETIFNNQFPSSRPDWLQFEGKRIELDGYCESLKLAFEYQGKYHYEEKAYWYSDRSISFERRQLIDSHKRVACLKNKVILIEINELNPTKKPNEWKEIIKKALESKGVTIPNRFDKAEFGANEFYTSKNYLDEAHQIAKLKKGFCISKSITYKTQPVDWECNKGHAWTASLRQITSKNTWCPRCAGKVRLTLDQMHELAKQKEGKCLSKEYLNAKSKLLWECNLGHQWLAVPASIQRGTWCNICCGNTVITIDDLKKIAANKRGVCLSSVYHNNKNALEWKCEFGHIWKAAASAIKSGSWCPKCAGTLKLTIEDMDKLAKLKGGKCLSTLYSNANTKLLWECKLGHQFYLTPSKVKHIGRWCKLCKRIKKTL